MKRVLILGHTGVIGRQLLLQSLNLFECVCGMSRHEYFKSDSGAVTTKSLDKALSLNETRDLVYDYDLILNSAWSDNNRMNRNSNSHRNHGQWEEALINTLIGREIKYVSLGSIAELMPGESSTSYAQEKRRLALRIQESLGNFLWLRVASSYGLHDRRDWFIPQLLSSAKQGKELRINNHDASLNFIHVDELAREILLLALTDKKGPMNLYTNQWYKLIDVAKGLQVGKEPKSFGSPTVGLFDEFDRDGHRIDTPPLVGKLRLLVREV